MLGRTVFASTLGLLAFSLASSCSGGGGGGGGGGGDETLDLRVTSLEGDWQVTLDPGVARGGGGCLPPGLSGETLELDLIDAFISEGAHVAGYRVRSPGLDTASPVVEGETTLEVIVLSDGPEDEEVFLVFFGAYYDPEEDRTVELDIDLLGVHQVEGGHFRADLECVLYEGYQIVAEPLEEGGYSYLADPEAFPLCEGSVTLEGEHLGLSTAVVFSGSTRPGNGSEAIPLLARHWTEPDILELQFGFGPQRLATFTAPLRGGGFAAAASTEAGPVLLRGAGAGDVLRGALSSSEPDEGGWELEFEAARVEGRTSLVARPEAGTRTRWLRMIAPLLAQARQDQ